MNSYRKALIEYWIEIGKIKRVRSQHLKNLETGEIYTDKKSSWIYIFVREDGENCTLTTSWNQFFEMFNLYNKISFEEKILRPEYLPWQPFDPWNNIFFRADIQRMAKITSETLAELNKSSN